jgi:multidrug efflux system membrane fusion protein
MASAAVKSASGKFGGMKVDVSLPGNGSEHYEGEVHFLDNAVDSATGTILMKAVLPNSEEKLTPGQFLNVRLRLDTLRNAVTVPNEAVQQGAEGNFIYVVKADSSVEMRTIEVAAADAGLTAISKGLQGGETVVTDGQLRLTPGIKIRVRENGAAASAGKAAEPQAATAAAANEAPK